MTPLPPPRPPPLLLQLLLHEFHFLQLDIIYILNEYIFNYEMNQIL